MCECIKSWSFLPLTNVALIRHKQITLTMLCYWACFIMSGVNSWEIAFFSENLGGFLEQEKQAGMSCATLRLKLACLLI
jgi:hypothetical protein